MNNPDRELAALAQHPGFAVLCKRVEQVMDRHFHTLAVEFATRGKQPDYAELQWQRGFLACLQKLPTIVNMEAKALAKLLAQEQGGDT